MKDAARRGWGRWSLPLVLTLSAITLAGAFALSGRLAGEDPKPEKTDPPKKEADVADTPVPENPFPKAELAPELDGGSGWLNTSGEISLKDLRGKVVILDFWTYCCINCMHVLPDLKYLEKKYDKQLVVIGVHSAKFDNEKETENIRRAIMRYEIVHPVINDSEMKVWRKFDVSAWPTLVVIDPEGRYCGQASGEGNRELLDIVMQKLIAYHKAKGTLDETPVKFALEHEKSTPTPLRFPGKIVADAAGRRLFISDSNHNRIVVASMDGKLLDVIGSGQMGKKDGAFDVAQFDHPQGMSLSGDTLYVADTENHLLRAVDLKARTVKTIAGTGEQSHDRLTGGPALETPLNSPWDVRFVEGQLYIAMAGPHQIWTWDPDEHLLAVHAGNGREDIRNGTLKNSAFGQPSGITTDGKFLYTADAEGSAIRKVPLTDDAEVTTLAGASDLPRGRSLFEFGDIDGTGDAARLQHPLGLTFHNGLLYVADSYNHKLKTVDPATGETKTFLGDGTAGNRDEPPRFSEPAGLAVAFKTLYVADTNNHLIRTVDLETKKVGTLPIEGLKPPERPKGPAEETVKPLAVESQKVAPGESLAFEIAVALPEGYKLNKLAPPVYRLAGKDQQLVAAEHLDQRMEAEAGADNVVKFSVPLSGKTGEAQLTLTLAYNYCREGEGGLCKLGTIAWTVPVNVAEGGEKAVKLSTGPGPAPRTAP